MVNTQSTIKFKLVILLGGLSALGAFSTDIYLPALNSMADNLDAETSQVQVTLGIFFLGFGFGQLLFGPISDSLGRRPVLLIGLYSYTAASVACVLSTHIDFLIASRLCQALGGCAAAVTSRAIVRDLTSGLETTQILTSIMGVVQLAPLIAPLIGGAILLFFAWQSTFVVLSVLGTIAIICAHLWINESHPQQKRQPLKLSNILLGYVETLGNINIVLLLVAEVAISVCLLTFVTGSSRLFSQYYGLNPLSFGMLFAFMTSALLIGSYLHKRLLILIDIDWLISGFLIMGLMSGVVLFLVALLIPENMLLIIFCLWFCLFPCIALRASYASLGLQYMPERTGTVSALFGAFGLGCGGIIAISIGLFEGFTPVTMASFILAGFVSSIASFTVWKLYRNRVNPAHNE